MDRQTLEKAGVLLLGPDWKLPLASVLGPHHPEGAREKIDPRLVRRWAAGDRAIPGWVAPVIIDLLMERSKELNNLAWDAAHLAERLIDEGGGYGKYPTVKKD